jgi:hypothetical protein
MIYELRRAAFALLALTAGFAFTAAFRDAAFMVSTLWGRPLKRNVTEWMLAVGLFFARPSERRL